MTLFHVHSMRLSSYNQVQSQDLLLIFLVNRVNMKRYSREYLFLVSQDQDVKSTVRKFMLAICTNNYVLRCLAENVSFSQCFAEYTSDLPTGRRQKAYAPRMALVCRSREQQFCKSKHLENLIFVDLTQNIIICANCPYDFFNSAFDTLILRYKNSGAKSTFDT